MIYAVLAAIKIMFVQLLPRSKFVQRECIMHLAAIIWWLIGFGLAMGDSPSRFIGTSKFGLLAKDFEDGTGYSYASWLFQWVRALMN